MGKKKYKLGWVDVEVKDLVKAEWNYKEEDKKQTTNNVTNNALFVGSTSELSKMLKQGILNNKENSSSNE